MKKALILIIAEIFLTGVLFASQTKTNSIGQNFVYIKPGTFRMGPDKDSFKHYKIKLTNGFYMQSTEVTQGQWYDIMKTKPWMFEGKGKKGENYAATCISWNDAKEFIRRLNKRERTKRYRLPYEAEWEYACRAGNNSEYCYGDFNEIGKYAWFDENSIVEGDEYHYKKVGLKKPNKWGLYDMNGNVWEWCEDWFGYYKEDRVIDPKGSSVGYTKVYRGGSWNCDQDDFEWRGHKEPSMKPTSYSLGFRLVMDVKEPDKVLKKRKIFLKKKPKYNMEFSHGNTNFIGQKFVYINPGTFIMGTGKYGKDKFYTKHKVTITNGFYIQITEVTQRQWFDVMKTKPWHNEKYTKEGKKYPAVCVSWVNAKEFVEKLNKLEGTNKYRLPTEAEWEYSCRATSNSNEIENLDEISWYSENSSFISKVAQKKPNKWGLYDMLGNVYEWCSDWHYYYPNEHVFDPQGPLDPPDLFFGKIKRGGCYNDSRKGISFFLRNKSHYKRKHASIGFRIVRSE